MTATLTDAPPRGRGLHLGAALAVLACAQLIIALDLNIVFVALPEIGSGLGFSAATLQWVVGAYTVFTGGFLLLGGRAADLLGRRRVFVFALVLYAGSSLAGGLAGAPGVIVAARAVQGIGGALLFPATLSLVTTLFEEGPARNRALAVWGGAGASGLSLGALLGGVLTDAFGWSAVFFVNVPLAGLVALAALATIPPDGPRPRGRSFDLPGAATATGGVMALVFVLVQGPEAGWGATEVVAAAVTAVVLLGAFAAIETRGADPLMPPRLLRNRSLLVAMAVTGLYLATFGALPYFLTVVFQQVQGMTPLQTGLAFLVPSLAIAAGTQLGERMATRAGARLTLAAGFAIGVPGTALMALAFTAEGSYADVVPGLIVSGVGQGIAWTAMWIASSAGVAAREQGVASGMASTTFNVGNAVGIALLVALANRDLDGRAGEALRAATADGSRTAALVATAGLALGVALAFALPRAARE